MTTFCTRPEPYIGLTLIFTDISQTWKKVCMMNALSFIQIYYTDLHHEMGVLSMEPE